MRIPRHLPLAVVTLAWLMFIFSFFLPATDVLSIGGTAPDTPLTGWQAFTTSFEVFGSPFILLIPQEPRLLLLLAFPPINLVMLLSPLLAALVWERAWILSGLLLPFGIVPWLLPKDFTGNLFAGFYLWDSSFFLMGAGCILASIAWKQACETEIQRLHDNVA